MANIREASCAPGGGPLRWRCYDSNLSKLDRCVQPGDRLFLVTVRPGGQLWLAAVYENVYRSGMDAHALARAVDSEDQITLGLLQKHYAAGARRRRRRSETV